MVPFGILQYIQCIRHGLTFFLLCVSFLLFDSLGCQFMVAQLSGGFFAFVPESYASSVVTGLITEVLFHVVYAM